MPNQRFATIFVALVAWAWLMATEPALAQASGHLRGTVGTVDGRTLTVKISTGDSAKVLLADGAGLFMVTPSDVSKIRPGQFVGITSVEAEGRRVAREVHVFDESLRGLGEGHYPWDLLSEPNMMTNANIAEVVGSSSGQALHLRYAGGEQTIIVPPDAVVVDFAAATPDRLAPGREVFLIANRQDDGTYLSPAVVIGENGAKPPM
jgi:hypothetical protein